MAEMKPGRGRFAYIVGGDLPLEAPAVLGAAFIGRTGWVGVHCPCGWTVTGRSLSALEGGLADHQQPAHCAAWAEVQAERLDAAE